MRTIIRKIIVSLLIRVRGCINNIKVMAAGMDNFDYALHMLIKMVVTTPVFVVLHTTPRLLWEAVVHLVNSENSI